VARFDWTREELVLALDLYVQAYPHAPGKGSAEVRELSTLLRSLPIHPVADREPEFRNIEGVYLKLMNFRALDPRAPGVGMPHGAHLDGVIWDEYGHDPERLRRVAREIKAGASVDPAEVAAVRSDDDAEEVEGGIVTAAHRRRERSRSLARRKRADVRQQTGRLACEACGLDFDAVYGPDIGEGVSECHHRVPLATSGPTRTRLKDLAILCANCHRAVHRLRPMDLEELQRRVNRAG
jgi:5-methylcytosine-specific restriction protein A